MPWPGRRPLATARCRAEPHHIGSFGRTASTSSATATKLCALASPLAARREPGVVFGVDARELLHQLIDLMSDQEAARLLQLLVTDGKTRIRSDRSLSKP